VGANNERKKRKSMNMVNLFYFKEVRVMIEVMVMIGVMVMIEVIVMIEVFY
tara:strand:+ start:287 stop:439 length:153 start_codon:yes stop_codon:yes gene_type:complete